MLMGYKTQLKKGKLFAKMKKEGHHIIFWQETHLTKKGNEKRKYPRFKNISSEGEGSHGWPSLPFILGTLLSQSGSGEAFLFPGRGCFPLSVQRKSSRVNSHTNIPACADYEAGNF